MSSPNEIDKLKDIIKNLQDKLDQAKSSPINGRKKIDQMSSKVEDENPYRLFTSNS